MRLPSALGTIDVWLRENEQLEEDSGEPDGTILAWAPEPELGGFSLSHGPPEPARRPLIAILRGEADP